MNQTIQKIGPEATTPQFDKRETADAVNALVEMVEENMQEQAELTLALSGEVRGSLTKLAALVSKKAETPREEFVYYMGFLR